MTATNPHPVIFSFLSVHMPVKVWCAGPPCFYQQWQWSWWSSVFPFTEAWVTADWMAWAEKSAVTGEKWKSCQRWQTFPLWLHYFSGASNVEGCIMGDAEHSLVLEIRPYVYAETDKHHKTFKAPKHSGVELLSLVQSNPISGWQKVLPEFLVHAGNRFQSILAFLGYSREKKMKYSSTHVDGPLYLNKYGGRHHF